MNGLTLSKYSTRGPLALVTALAMTFWSVAPAAVAQDGPPQDAPGNEVADGQGDNASDQGGASRQQQGENRGHPNDEGDERGGGEDRSSRARAQQADPNGDVAEENDGVANRGSVKISDGLAADEHPDNEPHVGCEFSIDYFGFDGGERDFEIWLQPPTGSDVLVHSGATSLEDAQGAELSGSQPVTFEVLNADGELTEGNRHDQQGWHLKVVVAGADGDTEGPKKSKVFWIDCPSEDVAGADAEAASEERDVAVLGVSEERGDAARGAGEDQPAEVLGIQFERPPESEAAAADELPVTGTDAAAAVGIALAMMGVGALLLTAVHRRRRRPATS